jgi:hypothetical protein
LDLRRQFFALRCVKSVNNHLAVMGRLLSLAADWGLLNRGFD